MNLTFKSATQDPTLVHLYFNEVINPCLKDEPEYAGKLKKLMQINLTNSTDYPHINTDKFSHGNFNDMMQRIYKLGFKYTVVWFDGSWPGAEEFEEELLNQINNEWNDTKWLAAGHIINNIEQGDAPHWHEQCIVINMEAWAEIGTDWDLSFWNWENRSYPRYMASKESHHGDYTPLWMAGEHAIIEEPQDSVKHTNNPDEGPLNSLFPIAFSHDMYIHSFNQEVRRHKICIYPEDDIEFTKSWLFDYDFNTSYTLDESRSFGYDKVQDDKRELFQYKVMDTHIMYVTNTENVPHDDPLGIDTLIVPCSGLHQYKHVSNNRDTIKRVLWTDFSPFGIGWQEFVLKNWNGLEFDKFYKDNFNVITDLGLPSAEFINYDEQNALDFIDSYDSEEDWLEHWDFIRTIDHQFVKIDIVKEWDRLVELVGKDHVLLAQLSNIWQYEINYVNTPAFTAQAAFVDLMNGLLLNNKIVYFSGDTPNGQFFEHQDMRLLPGIM
jgi:hypothetical protein